MNTVRALFACLLLLGAAACGDDDGIEVPAGPPSRLADKAGDAQVGTVGQPVGTISAKVVDISGKPVPNVVISWGGMGTVAAASTQSGADGSISNQWTLGPAAGAQTMEARWFNRVNGQPVVLGGFTATANPR